MFAGSGGAAIQKFKMPSYAIAECSHGSAKLLRKWCGMGALIRMNPPPVPPISRREWQSLWQQRRNLSRRLAICQARLKLLQEAETMWQAWNRSVHERLEAGAEIEGE